MPKPKLTPVISITVARNQSLRNVINRNARINGAKLVKRPGQPYQFSVLPTGDDAA